MASVSLDTTRRFFVGIGRKKRSNKRFGAYLKTARVAKQPLPRFFMGEMNGWEACIAPIILVSMISLNTAASSAISAESALTLYRKLSSNLGTYDQALGMYIRYLLYSKPLAARALWRATSHPNLRPALLLDDAGQGRRKTAVRLLVLQAADLLTQEHEQWPYNTISQESVPRNTLKFVWFQGKGLLSNMLGLWVFQGTCFAKTGAPYLFGGECNGKHKSKQT